MEILSPVPIIDQIAALPAWQRARIDWVRVTWAGDRWAVTVSWQGMSECADPGEHVEWHGRVTHVAWEKPAPLVLTRADGAVIEEELTDLVTSGIIGDATCERIEEPGAARVRWRVQAWLGCIARCDLVDGPASWQVLLAAQADVAHARWVTARAEAALTVAMGEAMDGGLSAARAAKALGLSRSRVYQVRDGRR